MILIAAENVGAVDQICRIVYIINNVRIDVINIVGYIAITAARANTVSSSDRDAASTRNWILSNVSRIRSCRIDSTLRETGIDKKCIVGRKEDVIIAIIDVNLSRWQSG
jgi:hypothetical protein